MTGAWTTNPPAPFPGYLVPDPTQQLAHVTAAGGQLLFTGSCTLYSFNINTGKSGSTCLIYDGVDATGTLLGNIDTTTNRECTLSGGGWRMKVGIFINPSTTGDLTFAWGVG